MTDDPWSDPGWLEYADHCMNELVPKLSDSAVTVSLVPEGRADIKFAVELGMSIMLDKPIIAVVPPGAKVPAHLVAVADEIIEGDISTVENHEKLMKALTAAIGRQCGDGQH